MYSKKIIPKVYSLVIVELQRAKRASKVPRVRKIGNPSAYERLSERPSAQTQREREGCLEIFLTGTDTGN